jgi:heme exporter protein B
MSGPFAIFKRDMRLAMRHGADGLVVVAFFAFAAILFAFGVGPESLPQMAAGAVWVIALLSVLLSLDRLFQSDFEDGALDQILLAPAPLSVFVLAKLAAHWLATAIPLLVAAPIIAVMLQLDAALLGPLLLSLLLGTPTLVILGGVGAALTLGARRGHVLLALLVLPLEVPVLIFGAGAAMGGPADAEGALMILAAMVLAALALGPAAIAAALRQAAG